MKKNKLYMLIVSAGLVIGNSCQQENYSPDPGNKLPGKIDQVILDGIGVQDTLKFQYDNERVSTVYSCTQLLNECVTSHVEERYYNTLDELDSISGKWQISYSYGNNTRRKILAYQDGAYYSTTTFEKYTRGFPTRMLVEFATSEIHDINLTFNSWGDLTRKTVRNSQGLLVEDIRIEYSDMANPLRGLMETPSYAVLFFGFDDLLFYFSHHAPAIIVSTGTSVPGYPLNPPRTIQYRYELDNLGRISNAEASTEEFNTIMHNINIRYQ